MSCCATQCLLVLGYNTQYFFVTKAFKLPSSRVKLPTTDTLAMPAMNILVGGLNFTHAHSFPAGLNDFIADRNVVWNFLTTHWADFIEWIAQPREYK